MSIYSPAILLPLILASIASGILLIGTVLYIYIYSFDRKKLYFSIAVLGCAGLIYIITDIGVIFFSLTDFSSLGIEFHRIEALSAAFYIFALPCSIQLRQISVSTGSKEKGGTLLSVRTLFIT